jgi:hypothetical protein
MKTSQVQFKLMKNVRIFYETTTMCHFRQKGFVLPRPALVFVHSYAVLARHSVE